uniref:Uncharacterized protein n=1 Tax=Dromaius novaehollandiae TaxID=8790 RepID=A0A8C4JW24_DRONO
MCLVFCAFASWAVKTSDLQAPDAWKTMFLATFGTLSAIRYFRRQMLPEDRRGRWRKRLLGLVLGQCEKPGS